MILCIRNEPAWDLGQGVMDDAGGVMISVMALAVLKELGMIPKRTLQTILWTSEEPGTGFN